MVDFETDSSQILTLNQILILIPVSLISITILLGNSLVILAIIIQKNLRTPPNVYLLSLACIDLSVGIFIIPFNISQVISKSWKFGKVLCSIWLVSDVTLCSLSIYHLIAIAVDRYRAVTEGIHYVQQRSVKSVLLTISCLWIFALWISTPPALGWNNGDWGEIYDDDQTKTNNTICQLTDQFGYVIHSSLGTFIFPLVLMVVIYVQIFRKIKILLQKRSKVQGIDVSGAESSDWDKDASLDENSKSQSLKSTNNRNPNQLQIPPSNSFQFKRNASQKIDDNTEIQSNNKIARPTSQIRAFVEKKLRFSLTKEKRAARTLGVIILSFLICWLPFAFLYVINAFLHQAFKPDELWFEIFTWLGYLNSAVNPFIYSVYNKEFRAAFKKILCLFKNNKS